MFVLRTCHVALRPLTTVAIAVLATGCVNTSKVAESTAVETDASPRWAVDVSERHQSMSGFGASSAWTAPRISGAVAEQLFSAEAGLGLSLLRIQIRPMGDTVELGTVDAAAAWGARIWAAPWSPQEEWKSNGSTSGGSLKPEFYPDWAGQLARFAASMNERGTPLLGLSLQNEPDYTAEWDTCLFTATQLAQFAAGHLVPALTELAPSVKLIGPESANWSTFADYSDALLNQPAIQDRLLALATHAYGGSPFDYPAAREHGHEVWMTEWSDANHTTDTGMGSALRVASQIQTSLSDANVSAWHYWWIMPRGDKPDTNAGLFDKQGVLTKRAYALGQFARFVRPGYVRIGSPQALATQLTSSAYQSPDRETIAVVIVSNHVEAQQQTIDLPGFPVLNADLWVTDETHSLEPAEIAPERLAVSAQQGRVKVVIPARSVVTLVARQSRGVPEDASAPHDAGSPDTAAPDSSATTLDSSSDAATLDSSVTDGAVMTHSDAATHSDAMPETSTSFNDAAHPFDAMTASDAAGSTDSTLPSDAALVTDSAADASAAH